MSELTRPLLRLLLILPVSAVAGCAQPPAATPQTPTHVSTLTAGDSQPLDCPDGGWTMNRSPEDGAGYPTPEEALAAISSPPAPPGSTIRIAYQDHNTVTWIYSDDEGHRVAEVTAVKTPWDLWVVPWMMGCSE